MRIPVYTVKLKKHQQSYFFRNAVKYDGTPRSVLPLLRRHLSGSAQEHHVVVLLDSAYCVLGIVTTGIGSLCSVSAHPREVFKPAIAGNAYAIICAHSHPTNNASPSEADRQSHSEIHTAGKALSIPVLDDIIIGESGSYFSFKDESDVVSKRKLTRRRDRNIDKATRRIERGNATYRDVVFVSDRRIAKIPEMLRAEIPIALQSIIQDLEPITQTPSRIWQTTRQRANELYGLCRELLAEIEAGKPLPLGRMFSVLMTPPPEKQKGLSIPELDFIQLPGKGKAP